jgi:hypothetical protein
MLSDDDRKAIRQRFDNVTAGETGDTMAVMAAAIMSCADVPGLLEEIDRLNIKLAEVEKVAQNSLSGFDDIARTQDRRL